jgi:hypothetical protein
MVVGRTLGWQHVKSTAFDLTRDGDRYRFSGHGSGHGVGLCVIGSTRLAVAGRSASEILARYFPGLVIGTPADVSSILVETNRGPRPVPAPRGGASGDAAMAARPAGPPAAPPVSPPVVPLVPAPPAIRAAVPAVSSIMPEVLVSLPAGDQGELTAIVELTGRARAALARVLEVPEPRVRLRFHPTVASYEQATSEPWFTSAAIVSGEIHLLPPAVLRERGVLERTIRHELVHTMTNATLAGRAQWIREGAAIYFAGRPPIPGETQAAPAARARTSCPKDGELLQPVSVGSLTNAYARAESCFARQVAERKSWRDVK